MKFRFVVEDKYGPYFIEKLFKKKIGEGVFSGKLAGVRSCSISSKLKRIVNASFFDAEHVIILMDADGQPLDEKTKLIKQYLDPRHLDCTSIVLLDYEIEEWICYSQDISVKEVKPSKILKRSQNYQKNHLPRFAEKLDCEKLANCPSFLRLTHAIRSA